MQNNKTMKVKTTWTPYERIRSLRIFLILGSMVFFLFALPYVLWSLVISGATIEMYLVVTPTVGGLSALIIYMIWYLYKTERSFESREIDENEQERIINALTIKLTLVVVVCLLLTVFSLLMRML